MTRLMLVSAVPFVALSTWLGLAPIGDDPPTLAETLGLVSAQDPLAALAPTALGLSLAIAVFATNFSFIVFQLAPYRALLAGPSRLHVGVAASLLVLALVPLVGAAAGLDV